MSDVKPGIVQTRGELVPFLRLWLLAAFISWMAVVGMITTGRWCLKHAEAAIVSLECVR